MYVCKILEICSNQSCKTPGDGEEVFVRVVSGEVDEDGPGSGIYPLVGLQLTQRALERVAGIRQQLNVAATAVHSQTAPVRVLLQLRRRRVLEPYPQSDRP